MATLAAVSFDGRLLALGVVAGALVLTGFVILSLCQSPSAQQLLPPARARAGRRVGSRAALGFRGIEVLELVAFLAVTSSVLGRAVSASLGLEGGARWVACLSIVLLHLPKRPLHQAITAAPAYLFLLLMVVFVITAVLNLTEGRAVPIVPSPVVGVDALERLPPAVILQSFAFAAAILAGVAILQEADERSGRWPTSALLAGLIGVLFLFTVALFVAYGIATGRIEPSFLEAVRHVFGPGTPVRQRSNAHPLAAGDGRVQHVPSHPIRNGRPDAAERFAARRGRRRTGVGLPRANGNAGSALDHGSARSCLCTGRFCSAGSRHRPAQARGLEGSRGGGGSPTDS